VSAVTAAAITVPIAPATGIRSFLPTVQNLEAVV